MKKIYDKNESNFALIWIAIYVILASVCDNISGTIGIAKIVFVFSKADSRKCP